jgi:hypothetical protein
LAKDICEERREEGNWRNGLVSFWEILNFMMPKESARGDEEEEGTFGTRKQSFFYLFYIFSFGIHGKMRALSRPWLFVSLESR